MKLNEIQELWDIDCKINITILQTESVNIPQLHNKYYRILSNERLILKNLEFLYKELFLQKYEFLTQGETKETKEKGWVLPAKGCVLKQEAPMYLEADKNLNEITGKIALQKEKMMLTEDILKTIHQRNFIIKNIIDYLKFQAGEL